MLRFTDLSLRRGRALLFDGASFQIPAGAKVGVVGANGSGKSSLFALLLGELQSDRGEVQWPSGWIIAHVAQEAPHGPGTALSYTLDGDQALRRVEARLELARKVEDGAAEAEALAEFEALDGYSAHSRAGVLLHGLGFNNAQLEQPVDTFSGGWRVRLNLAQALMCRSDLLLLDEPTNHLDLDAVVWLEQWLRAYDGTLLLISHDRDVLDGVTDSTIAIEDGSASLYTGHYSAYERLRSERLAAQQAAYRKQQREIAHMRAFVDRFRAKATKARQAQSRLKALERMEEIAPAQVDSPFRFRMRAADALPSPLLRLDDLRCGYGEITVLDGVNLSLTPGDRIGLLGRNGAGKSTLIKTLAGRIDALGGERRPARNATVGYFAQHQIDQLDPASTPLEHFTRLDPDAREQVLRTWLGGFGFVGDKVFEPVAPFSGGEKSRLALALLVYRKPNILLLDEPTNHLDLRMRQALATALQEFPGAMVIVSHDRHLLRLTVDRLLLVDAGAVREFDESLDDYPRWLAERERRRAASARPAAGANSAVEKKARKRREAEARAQLAPLRKALKAAEQQLDDASANATKIERELADEALYNDDQRERLATLLSEQAAAAKRVARHEREWLEASEALEAMERSLSAG